MTALDRLRAVGISVIVPIIALVGWWFGSADSTSPFYPSLETIASNFRENWLFSRFGSDVVPSLTRLGLGYLVAVVAGVGLGILFGRQQALYRAFRPAVEFARSVPATALVPVVIVLLGLGDAPKIWLIGFVTMFPILLNTIDGVRSVEPGLEDVGRSFRLTRRQRIMSIQLPAAAPQIFAGMRIALTIAFVMMVITEMIGATNGIGFVTLNAQQAFQVPLLWSGMILLGLLGALLNIVFVVAERRVLRWHHLSTQKEK